VFFTNTNSTDLDTSRAVKAAQKAQAKAAQQAQAASAVASKKAQAAAAKAQAASAAAAQKAASRAQAAGAAAATRAQGASATAQTAAKSAADTINSGVRQGVLSARSWAAPKLEDAAEYTTSTVAPKVSGVLRATAGKVSPADTKSRKMSALTWSLLAAAIAAGIGAVAALVRYRYQAAISADSETAADVVVVTEDPLTGTQPASTQVGDQLETTPDDPAAADASVNGRVSSTGW
jgi:trimeric autotransporter adhesin